MNLRLAILFITTTLGLPALGQPTAPSTGPASGPATTPAPPRVVTPPPGFVPITVDGIQYLAEPADEGVVRAALQGVPPATMPSTQPADMLQRLAGVREQLKTRIITDLALTEAAKVDEFLDTTLKKVLTSHRDARPKLIYLVTSEKRLKELLRAGWTDPRFYYNRLADGVEVNWNLSIPVDRPADESLVPAIYLPDESADQRKKKIADSVRTMEQRLADYLASHANDDCYNAIIEFLISQTVEPVKNKLDREWITTGICGVLTSRYVTMITGRNAEQLILQLSAERPDIPLRQTAVNLINPLDPKTMRQGAAPVYLVVYTRKSIRICNEWIAKAGDAAIPKVLQELRKNPPESGTATVEMIKRVSGVDLTASVKG